MESEQTDDGVARCSVCEHEFCFAVIRGRLYCRVCADIEEQYVGRVLKARLHAAMEDDREEDFDRLTRIALFLGRSIGGG